MAQLNFFSFIGSCFFPSWKSQVMSPHVVVLPLIVPSMIIVILEENLVMECHILEENLVMERHVLEESLVMECLKRSMNGSQVRIFAQSLDYF